MKKSGIFDHDLKKDYSYESDRKDYLTKCGSNCSEDNYTELSSSSPDHKGHFLDDPRRSLCKQEKKVFFTDEDGNIYEGETLNGKKHGIGK